MEPSITRDLTPISLKLAVFSDIGMERYPSSKLDAEIHFYCIEN